MNAKQQLFCAWCGPIFMVMFGLGFVVFARFVPPLAPSMDMNEVAATYQSHTAGIKFGMCIAMMGTAFLMPWVALISRQMLRIKESISIWASTQLGAGIGRIILIIIPCLLWIVATFRPDRDPELTYLIYDTAWITFVLPVPAFAGVTASATTWWAGPKDRWRGSPDAKPEASLFVEKTTKWR